MELQVKVHEPDKAREIIRLNHQHILKFVVDMKLQIHNHYQTIKAVYGLLNSKNKDDHEVGYDLLIKFINDLKAESEGYTL